MGHRTKRDGELRLPRIGIRTAELLDTYGEYHLSALRAGPDTAAIHAEVSEHHAALQKTLHSRWLAERLATRADDMALSAELELEASLRTIYGQLQARHHEALLEAAFPKGLSAALEPRAAAQVAEATRVCDSLRAATARSLAKAVLKLRELSQLLQSRLAAADAAHDAMLAAIVAEQKLVRELRLVFRHTRGRLAALYPDREQNIARFFKVPRAKHATVSALPPVPPLKRSRAKRRGKGAR